MYLSFNEQQPVHPISGPIITLDFCHRFGPKNPSPEKFRPLMFPVKYEPTVKTVENEA